MKHVSRIAYALFRVGFAESVAYRAEILVWVLSTTMPFVMLMLWSAVAEHSPVIDAQGQSWNNGSFVAYFLCVFVVRQLIACWAAWEIAQEIRSGQLAMRLLRPIHPLWGYMATNLSYLPIRALIAAPVVAVLLLSPGAAFLTRSPTMWVATLVSIIGAWAISFFINVAIGGLSFFIEQSQPIMELYFATFVAFSGYLIPITLYPEWLRTTLDYLPFRFQVGLPVELATGAVTLEQMPRALAAQWGWVLGLALLGSALWRLGAKRFQAYGG